MRRRRAADRGARAQSAPLEAAGGISTTLVRGADPVDASAPIPGHRLRAAAQRPVLDDIDLVEINEAFASVVLAWPERDRVGPGEGYVGPAVPSRSATRSAPAR